MFSTERVAKTLYMCYFEKYKKYPDEMIMHKLMYFLQKENLIRNSKFLFMEDFYGWDYGMVLTKSVRKIYYPAKHYNNGKKKNNPRYDGLYKDIDDYKDNYLLNLISDILDIYGKYSATELSALSHRENSWKKSQEKGNSHNNKNDVLIEKFDILLDALKEKHIRKVLGV